MKQRMKSRNFRLKAYAFSALIAVELLMSFTFLGYIHIQPISITYAYIPILAAAAFLGIWESTVLGAVFGLASMFKASAYYVMPLDKAFSPFASGFPLESILLSVGTRMLFGFLMGLVFAAIRNKKQFPLKAGIVCALAPKVHSILVYGAIGLFFPAFGYDIRNGFSVGISDVVAALLCVGVIEALWAFWRSRTFQRFYAYMLKASGRRYRERKATMVWAAFMLCVLTACVSTAVYFSQRMAYMLQSYGLPISSEVDHDLMHLQIQFLIALLALYFILVLSMIILFRYLGYREFLSGLDGLTGVMGRKLFLGYCENLQKKTELFSREGWFIYVDVDYFKSINDSFGHPTGDAVLRAIASVLRQEFDDCGYVGRLGGDEFAIILDRMTDVEELEEKLKELQREISEIGLVSGKVTVSIGVCQFHYPQDMQGVYVQADKILYEAKSRGRACYVFGTLDGQGV